MEYLEFKVSCTEEYREILIAELSELGFDSFLETDTGFDAYVEDTAFDTNTFDKLINRYQKPAQISIEKGKLEKINWNEEWEKNYDPIYVGKDVYIRASFHETRPEFTHEILINPKMSFGTGHHATTFLMVSHQLEIDHKHKSVLDIGSGTGILAIMAHKLGTKKVQAFDIDEWCVENGNENFALNGMDTIQMGQGTVREVQPKGPFDIVLANINKNVLLDEMAVYASLLEKDGKLLLSGFYEQDISDIEHRAKTFNLHLKNQKTKDSWAALLLEKQ